MAVAPTLSLQRYNTKQDLHMQYEQLKPSICTQVKLLQYGEELVIAFLKLISCPCHYVWAFHSSAE